MKKSRAEIEDRQDKVRELLLKGYRDSEIIQTLGITQKVFDSDHEEIAANYTKAITENKYLLAKQAEAVLKHLDQLDMIKKKLWDVQNNSETAKDTKGQLESLKGLLTELEHESKILRLIDTSHTIIKNYIHIDKINVLMNKLTEVIQEFVPSDKQKYAYERIKDLGPILDTECTPVVDALEDKK